ncbi:MAG: murE [Chlamydiales bacterium]|nr:murE [Chlamydiales bacterium]
MVLSMKLKKIFKDIPAVQIKGGKDVEVTGISANSKLVAPGNLFIAKRGSSYDGSLFIPEAISAGASAILTDIFNPSLKNTLQVIHKDPASIESFVSAAYYNYPSDELFLVGITGTSGKTTTSFLIKYLLDQLRLQAGLLGTIEYIVGNQRYQASHTTADVSTNHKLLRDMVRHGCQSAVMEVSSHALEQGRVDLIDFDLCLFTNLSQDHLDYHQTMDAYFQVKAKLFQRPPPRPKKKKWPQGAIINQDCPWGRKLCQEFPLKNPFTYGIDSPADLKGHLEHHSAEGMTLSVSHRDQTYQVKSPLVGKFNASNLLAAFAVGIQLGTPGEKIAQILSHAPKVSGRLEKVNNPLGISIYVDYAHKPAALENTLQALRAITPAASQLITVFGCGGNRDRAKRPLMGAIAERYSDAVIITSDNPRSEDPAAICEEIEAGLTGKTPCQRIIDRKQAIEEAIFKASPQDIILIAGKGHETYQIFHHKTISFDDVAIAEECCHKIALAKV